MDHTTVFSKTGKGLLEVKNRSNRITKEQYRVLSLVDGKANLDDLAERARMNASALRQILTQLSESGYIKVLVSSSSNDNTGLGAGAITGSYYVDDLDFAGVLGPAGSKRPSVYQSTETERRQRESAERKAAEAAASKRREEEERRHRDEAARYAKEEGLARRVREEAELKGQQEAQRQVKLESELKARLEGERRVKEEAALRARAEVEAKLKAEIDRQLKEATAQKRLEEQTRLKMEAERKRQEEEIRLRKEAEERVRQEEETRRRQAIEEQKRKEAEEQRLLEVARKLKEEERQRKEEAARKQREDEERRKTEEEKERKRKEEEERKRKEEEERKRREAEEHRRREEEERRRQEAERRKQEDERRLKEDQERKRKVDEERKRKEEEDRKLREQDQCRQQDEARRRKEDEERLQREAAERERVAQEDRVRREQAERAQLEAFAEQRRLEDEVRRHKAEKDRRRREQEESNAKDAQQPMRDAAEREAKEAKEDKWLLDEMARLDRSESVRPDKSAQVVELPVARHNNRRRRETAGSVESLVAQIPQREQAENSQIRKVAVPSAKPGPNSDELNTAVFRQTESLDVGAAVSRLDVPEVIEDITDVGESIVLASTPAPASTIGVTEEDIRLALEEQERRWRMEEEARAAFERAELEAQVKAEKEAREIAEASARARKEAEERAREESERRRREEKEQREREEAERRVQRESERRAREHARHEAERRKREDDLVNQRKEQEEREVRKLERDRIQKDLRRVQITPFRILIGVVALLAVVSLLVIQFASLSPWAPDIERIASRRIGEPVHIASVRAKALPGFQIVLEGVTVGASQDVRASTVTLVPQLGSLFSPNKVLDSLEIKGVNIGTDGLRRAGQWLKGASANPGIVDVSHIKIKDVTLDVPGVALPSINANLKLGREGELLGVFAATVDDRLRVDFLPRGDAIDITVTGHNFTLPVGPSLEVTDLQGKGTLSNGELHLSSLEYFFFGGQGKAEMRLRWQGTWALDSNFDIQRVSLEPALRAFKIQVVSDGAIDAKGIIRLQSPKFDTLFQRPEIDASFSVRRGNLAGFDIPRALQQRHRDGVQGGKTLFEELTGNVQGREGHYQYRQVKLTAGVLKANGQVDISSEGRVSGRIAAELRSSAGVVRGNFSVSGNDQATMLKP